MGSVSRVFSALGGLFLLLLVVSLFLMPAVQTVTDPADADFPGGRWGIVLMLLGMASVPGTGAVLLFRRAFRTAAPGRPSLDTASALDQRQQPATESAVPAALRNVSWDEPVTATDPAPAAPATTPPFATTEPASGGRRETAAWLTRVHPALRTLLGTSFGRGVLTTAIGVPLAIASGSRAPVIGPFAMTIFSLVDPIPMAVQPRWWRNAFISGTVCFVLYLIFAATVQIVSHQPDSMIGFILPFITYPATMALSGAIRFFRWLSPSAATNERG
jgi:hypothetical protein